MTYAELKRKYPTNADGSPWYLLPDAELQADLAFAAQLRELGQDTPESAGSGIIEGWIAHELRARAQRQPVQPSRPSGPAEPSQISQHGLLPSPAPS